MSEATATAEGAAPAAEPTAGAVAGKIAEGIAARDAQPPKAAPAAPAKPAAELGKKTSPAPARAKPPVPPLDEVARKDRELLDRETKLKEREATIKDLEDALTTKNLKAFIKRAGMTPTEVIEKIAEAEEEAGRALTPDEIKALARKEAEEELARKEKAREEAEAKGREAKLEESREAFRKAAAARVEADAERFELIVLDQSAEWGAEEARLYVEGLYEATGEKVTLDEALDSIEGKLLEREKAKRAKSKKVAALWGGSVSAGTESGARGENGTQASGRGATPSNSNRNAGGTPVVDIDKVSDDEILPPGRAAERFLRKHGLRA